MINNNLHITDSGGQMFPGLCLGMGILYHEHVFYMGVMYGLLLA